MNTIMMNEPLTNMANMFREMEALLDFDYNKESKGLKRLISRPHNLITRRDKDGKVVSFDIEVVYTPFKKDDVKVKIFNDEILKNVLTVKCGEENKIKDEDMDWCGVSHKSYQFSVPLHDCIDVKKISAKAEDGMLRITLPVKVVEETEKTPITINVN